MKIIYIKAWWQIWNIYNCHTCSICFPKSIEKLLIKDMYKILQQNVCGEKRIKGSQPLCIHRFLEKITLLLLSILEPPFSYLLFQRSADPQDKIAIFLQLLCTQHHIFLQLMCTQHPSIQEKNQLLLSPSSSSNLILQRVWKSAWLKKK